MKVTIDDDGWGFETETAHYTHDGHYGKSEKELKTDVEEIVRILSGADGPVRRAEGARMTARKCKSGTGSESPSPVGCAWDDCFTALRKIKDLARVPNAHSVELRDVCYAMRAEIAKMLKYAPVRDRSDDLTRLGERLNRVVELANIMECGSLQMEIERTMESAYKRMP